MADTVSTEDSILLTVRKFIGGDENGDAFDLDLILAINSAIAVLTQLGVGPQEGFAIHDETSTWRDFIGDDPRMDFIYTYICLKVQMIFDPPTSNVVKEAKAELLREMEFRSFAQADTYLSE